MVVKVREEGRVRQRSLLIGVGVNEEGYREVLGVMIGDSESEESWGEFFSWLKGRGLHGVDLVVSDHHKGLVQAIYRHFQGATWQRCQTHFMRAIFDKTPKVLQKELHAKIRAIFEAPDAKTARVLLNQVLEEYRNKAPKATEVLEEGFEDAIAVLELPEPYRRRLRTTNMLERLNGEIRRRERVIRYLLAESRVFA
jgi:transposase-like protein